jgi:hypothetical protein
MSLVPLPKNSVKAAGIGLIPRTVPLPGAAATAKASKETVSGSSTAKSGAANRVHEAEGDAKKHAGDAAPDNSGLAAAAVGVPAFAAVPGQTSAAGKGSKSGIAPVGAGKSAGLREREAKGSANGTAPATGANGDADSSADVVGAVAGVLRADMPAAVAPNSIAVAGAAAAGATGAALTMHPFASSSGIATDKVSGTGHQTGVSAGHSFYDELDGASGSGLGDPKTLVSTPSVLEVGITGGAHGWLRVRAELEHTGEVTASLMASSVTSADALHKQLGAMSAYLKSEVVGVTSLAVTAPEKSGATQGLGTQANSANPGASGGSGAGSSSQQRGDGNEKAMPWAGFEAEYASQAVPAALLGSGVGGWLNVRA